MTDRQTVPAIAFLLLVAGFSAPAAAEKQVEIGVFGLFDPQELHVSVVGGGSLLVSIDGGKEVLADSLELHLFGRDGHIRVGASVGFGETAKIRSADGSFRLAVPGRIERRFAGVLQVAAHGNTLEPVVEMGLEDAVASVAAAESSPGEAAEALRAQAVAARSYFLGHAARHSSFDFCDTTHCQFLRSPPGANHPAREAAASTRGLILVHRGRPVPALYSRSCGGSTRTAKQVGLGGGGYPFYSVPCKPCREQPEMWQRRLEGDLARTLIAQPFSETARLQVARRAGWSAVPSNSYSLESRDGELLLEGTGVGHGVGLCQRGAAGMAADGASFPAILRHYFPNSALVSWAD